MTIITNRHDILVLFDVTNGNPNGDPDAGNMPRIDPTTNKGLISDVCLKRKIRNYASMVGKKIFIAQGSVLNDLIDESEPHAAKIADPKKSKDDFEKAALDWLCKEYYDIRAFGAVLATKNKVFHGSAYGQVRGPIQFTFSQSVHPITPLEISITRCAATNEKEKKSLESDEGSGGNRTMGNKHIVPYGLYVAKVFISPVFAKHTNFTDEDLTLFFQALENMFTHDHSAARGDMIVRGIYDFEHVGTQAEANTEQNKQEASLGCEHAHKLFEGITIKLRDGKEFPSSFEDYNVSCEWKSETLKKGIKLNLRHANESITGRR